MVDPKHTFKQQTVLTIEMSIIFSHLLWLVYNSIIFYYLDFLNYFVTLIIISLQNDRATSYETYIAVQNEIIAAYNELRDREFKIAYPGENMSYVEADKMYSDPRTSATDKERLKDKIEAIKLLIPQKFSEAEPKKSN